MKRFKKILCVVNADGSGNSAFDRAVSLARNNQADLTVITVLERLPANLRMTESGSGSKDIQLAFVNEMKAKLERMVKAAGKKMTISTKVLVGTPFLEIIREVLRGKHDLVIKSPENPSWLESLFGSDDMHVMRKCPCPVWMIKPGAEKSYHRILAAVNVETKNSEAEQRTEQALNRQILELASSLAIAEFSELHVAHSWQAIGESFMRGGFSSMPEEKIAEYVEQVERQHSHDMKALMNEVTDQLGDGAMGYLKPTTHLINGWARKEIPALAKRLGVDVVVMGTVARTGIPGFIMGNTAEMILNQLDCSVLAIKPLGFVTPVTLSH